MRNRLFQDLVMKQKREIAQNEEREVNRRYYLEILGVWRRRGQFS